MKLTHDFNKFLRVHFDVRSSLRNDRSSASPVNPLDYATSMRILTSVCMTRKGISDYDRSSFSDLFHSGRYGMILISLKDLNDTTKSRYVSNQVSLKLEFKMMEGLMLSSMGDILELE